MGILRGQPKQGKASEWISPAQMEPVGAPGPGGPPTSGARPVPARLRLLTAASGSDWLRGALHLSPGSLLWQPDSGVTAQAVELATATMLPAQGPSKRKSANVAMLVELETPAGRFQLEMDPVLFEMSQELVAEAAARRDQLGDV